MKMKFNSDIACLLLISTLTFSTSSAFAVVDCPRGESNVGAVGGGCLLGASVGTFIFPGVGTAVGCAAVGLGSWAWKLFARSETETTSACVDHAGKSQPAPSVELNDSALAKLPE